MLEKVTKEKESVAFKVVRRKDCSSYMAKGKYCRKYCNGDIIEAEKGSLGLFVFPNIKDAISFLDTANSFIGCILKEVKAIGDLRKCDTVAYIYLENTDNECVTAIEERHHLSKAPYGTYTCKKLKVIKKVPDKEIKRQR